jgi:predicted nucleic acid-binding protein
MGYLLDTCIVSELRKKNCNPGLLAWMAGEIRRGIELHRRKNPVEAGSLERWLLGLEMHYADRILPITALIADRWGRLCPQQPLPAIDGLIAATGLEHRLTVVTHNQADFRRSGVNTLDPCS